MTISRRGFIAGVALAGVAVPGAMYAQHVQRQRFDEQFPETPGEAVVELADAALQQLGDTLRGIWRFTLQGKDAGLPGLPEGELEMFLDVAPSGRGLRGYLDTPERLRGAEAPRYRVVGDLLTDANRTLRWRLFSTAPGEGQADYQCTVVLDEVWGEFGNAGQATLNGRIAALGRSLTLPVQDNTFVALKRSFPEARERTPLSPALLAWLIAPEHRLFHQLWHASRDKWHNLDMDKQAALRGLGWQPGPRDRERDARGRHKDRNGSGEDFFFMHRHMLRAARVIQDLPSWARFPLPQPELERDRVGFASYFDNHDGTALPPTWLAADDAAYTQWVRDIKTPDTFHGNFQVWESRYTDPHYLSTLTLAQFGSEMELGLHDWLHMRWASVPRDPSSGLPVPFARQPEDFAARWFEAENDFLGDPFSSHVNPVFWHFHGWIDDRIEDWFRAHERVHPGQVRRAEVNGVPWFAPGRWVEVSDPWLGPDTHGCSTVPGLRPGRSVEMDPETMKLALRIIFADDDLFASLRPKVPQRPWYARNLKLAKR
ncbi:MULTISPECIES: twin-arginine translocation signal domain-containing protein [Pseudomonas]|uniref:pyoverdine maturation tyrosinase PvdP n=1 Tax=Pseudomonas TaxID=286 RepID=UPI00244BF301|nr:MULTISPECIES: twin-arginine translocation signal domain-containing protein [Pseudomonas]MDH1550798.1 twin-arginine translocation signal domain-containing protein [Pseudomonas juntendi]